MMWINLGQLSRPQKCFNGDGSSFFMFWFSCNVHFDIKDITNDGEFDVITISRDTNDREMAADDSCIAIAH